MSLPASWVLLSASGSALDKAKSIREARDRLYGNRFLVRETDLRWVGEIGEIAFDHWLSRQNVPHDWLQEEAAGKPDFRVGHFAVGIKTVKRKAMPRFNYTVGITADHADEPADHFFFLSYEIPTQRTWLLGGIPRKRFLKKATHHRAGEWVHPSYQIRPGHEILNLPIAELVPPVAWLRAITPTA